MRLLAAGLLIVSFASGLALADTLELPASALERSGTVKAVYRVDPPAAGRGSFELDWTDSAGRLVERHHMDVDLARGATLEVPIDLRRTVTLKNTLHGRLTIGDRQSRAEAPFVARPPAGWDDLQIVIYQDKEAAQLVGMTALGVTGGKVLGIREPFTQADVDARVASLAAANLRWYVENIATDFYSAYHRWVPEHPQDVNWRYLALQAQHLRDPGNPAVDFRDPSLSDPEWLARIRARLAETVHAHAAYRPFWYTLGDEPGIADLAAAWDFDFSPVALAALRDWLRLRYGTLTALNAQWGTDFTQWTSVLPPTTTAAMQRIDENFSGWSDFKAFMDQSFADALRAGTDAVHAADPTALAAIEGGQIPGWGGYDYSRLANAVDAMEIYEAGANVDIVRSLNPRMVLLSTTAGTGPNEQRQLWHDVLQGARGLVVWDENDDIVGPDGRPGPRGQSEAALYAELRGGIGAQLLAAAPRVDDVAILYSPASFRVQWLLDQRIRGDAWTQRGSEAEGGDNATRVAMRRAADELGAIGLQPCYVSSALVERGALREGHIRTLILPLSIALSDKEAAEISSFAAAGGLVLSEGEPGQFDGHGRRLTTAQLAGAAVHPLPAANELAQLLAKQGATAGFAIAGQDDRPVQGIETHVLQSGGATLLAMQRTSVAPSDTDVVLALPKALYIRDIRGGAGWQHTSRLELRLDPVAPTLLVLSEAELPGLTLTLPASAVAGLTVQAHFALTGDNPAGPHALHVEIQDPTGQIVRLYSGNALLRGLSLDWPIPVAVNNSPGTWTVRARDILSGNATSATFTVSRP